MAGPSFDIDALINEPQHLKARSQNVEKIAAAWAAERISPDILPYEDVVLQELANGVQSQIMMIEEMDVTDIQQNFRSVILQTELERVKFMIRMYLRTRISKIDRYLYHCSTDATVNSRLSDLERQYVLKHQALYEKHCNSMFLRAIPPSGGLAKFNDTAAAGLSMVTKPNLRHAVFCKIIASPDKQIKVRSEIIELEKGNIVLISFEAIRNLILMVSNLNLGD